jgi:hypothetical protein
LAHIEETSSRNLPCNIRTENVNPVIGEAWAIHLAAKAERGRKGRRFRRFSRIKPGKFQVSSKARFLLRKSASRIACPQRFRGSEGFAPFVEQQRDARAARSRCRGCRLQERSGARHWGDIRHAMDFDVGENAE